MFTPTKGITSNTGKHPLSGLLGPNVSEWPYDSLALCKALELKSEQEITKQHFYKLELLKLSLQAKIPVDLIPSIFSQSRISNTTIDQSSEVSSESKGVSEPKNLFHDLPNPNSDVIMLNPNQKIKLQSFKFPPETSRSSSPEAVSRFHPENQSANAGKQPLTRNSVSINNNNNNITSNSNIFKRSHKRTASPARIGAKAVEALNENNTLSFKEEQEIQNSPSLNKTLASSQNDTANTNGHPEFVKSHRRYQSLPSVLKPSPFSPELFSFKTNFQSSNTRSTLKDKKFTDKEAESDLNKYKNVNNNNKRSHRKINSHGIIDLNIIDQSAEYTVNKKFKFGSDTTSLSNNSSVKPAYDTSNNSNFTDDTSDGDLHEDSTNSETTIEDDAELNNSKSQIIQEPKVMEPEVMEPKVMEPRSQEQQKQPKLEEHKGELPAISTTRLLNYRTHRRSHTLDSILN